MARPNSTNPADEELSALYECPCEWSGHEGKSHLQSETGCPSCDWCHDNYPLFTNAQVKRLIHDREVRAAKTLKANFTRQFCNDHDDKIRWLRGVALDETDLLEQILDWFDEAALHTAKEGKEKP